MTSGFPQVSRRKRVSPDGTGRATFSGRFAAVLLVAALVTGVLSAVAGRAWAPDDPKLAEYEKRRQKLTTDLAREHFALGMWCKGQGLSRQACDHFKGTLRLQPDHKDADVELGHVVKAARGGGQVTCQLHLRDGVQVKAKLVAEEFCVDTGSGVLLIPADKVDVLKIGKGESADVIVSDPFSGKARLQASSFAAKAKIGVVNVTRENLDQIRMARPCEACTGTGTQQCPRCGGKGRLYGTGVCETCGGTGKVQCDRCGGNGRLTCPKCGGSGWTSGMFGGFRFKCGRCNGRGTIDCRSCKAGMATCRTCKGKPVRQDQGPCPDCEGRKSVPCTACKGTGIKPMPPDVEKEVKKLLESTTDNRGDE